MILSNNSTVYLCINIVDLMNRRSISFFFNPSSKTINKNDAISTAGWPNLVVMQCSFNMTQSDIAILFC